MDSYCCVDQALPLLLIPGTFCFHQLERIRQAILQAQKLQVVIPGRRICTTNHQDILDLVVDGSLRASPDVVEQVEKAHVKFGLHRQLTKEEVQSSFRRALT